MFVPDEAVVHALTPTISAQQQADLDCLSSLVAAGAMKTGPIRKGRSESLVRVYLGRLRKSDPSRDWMTLAVPASDINYGWFMSQMGACQAAGSDSRSANSSGVWASLRMSDPTLSEYRIQILDGPTGYRLVADCLCGCSPAHRYAQDIADTPISLFRLSDNDDLVYSIWAGGSAYRVRVWKVGPDIVAQVLEASTRERPDFLTDSSGAVVVRTFEADAAVTPSRAVRWIYDGKAFSRFAEAPASPD